MNLTLAMIDIHSHADTALTHTHTNRSLTLTVEGHADPDSSLNNTFTIFCTTVLHHTYFPRLVTGRANSARLRKERKARKRRRPPPQCYPPAGERVSQTQSWKSWRWRYYHIRIRFSPTHQRTVYILRTRIISHASPKSFTPPTPSLTQ